MRVSVVVAAVVVCLSVVPARAQTPPQCPAPPACVSSDTPCDAICITSPCILTVTTSTNHCAGSTTHTNDFTTTAIGPQHICVGENRTVGCLVPAGKTNINTETEFIAAGAAIPTLSIWGLGVLAVGLGILALRSFNPSQS
jgi:hypothetical protein